MKKITTSIGTFILLVILFTDCRKKEVDIVIRCPEPGPPAPAGTSGNLDLSISNIKVINEFDSRMSFNLTGILDPAINQYVELRGSMQGDQNLWLEEDGVLRGTTVKALSGTKGSTPIDMVFVVDNSGSMGEEADSIASQIQSFTKFLAKQKLDVRFGCVGQDGSTNGGLDLTSQDSLSLFLSRSRSTGRTAGFEGRNAANLRSKAATYRTGGENSIIGLYFAHDNFSWRPDAVRVYICFTDEPTQSSSSTQKFSNGAFKTDWSSNMGTVNMVFSVDDYQWNNSVPDTARIGFTKTYERPWEIAQYTGGTTKFIHSDCRDLSLLDLPVTQALSRSFVVEFCTNQLVGEHDLKVIIKTKNGTSVGSRTFSKLIYK